MGRPFILFYSDWGGEGSGTMHFIKNLGMRSFRLSVIQSITKYLFPVNLAVALLLCFQSNLERLKQDPEILKINQFYYKFLKEVQYIKEIGK